jgi:hypothetical protein
VAGRVAHRRTIALNRGTLGLAATGGSDAHHLKLIGTARTAFEGHSAVDFLASLRADLTEPFGRFWSARDHLHGFAEQQWKAMVVSPTHKLLRAMGQPAD